MAYVLEINPSPYLGGYLHEKATALNSTFSQIVSTYANAHIAQWQSYYDALASEQPTHYVQVLTTQFTDGLGVVAFNPKLPNTVIRMFLLTEGEWDYVNQTLQNGGSDIQLQWYNISVATD